MKRNRESKCRIRIINYQHRNKQGQKELDDLVQNYGFTYYQLYQLIFEGFYERTNLFEIVNNLIDSYIESNFSNLQIDQKLCWNSFLDNILPIDKPCYLGVDLGYNKDCVCKVHLEAGDTNNLNK